MNLKYFINKQNKEYEIILSGGVGFDINGKDIANEIRFLNTIGATKITERINSGGGSVSDGYDIVDANLNSKAIIETIITGLAASTAGWLAATGTKGNRFIVDYGKGMIHDPSIGNNTIETMDEGSDKDGLIQIKDSIATILSNNSNLNKNKINELMTKETWLSAEEWVSNGFADKVIKTTDKPIIKNTYNILEFVNTCHEFNNNDNLKTDNKMDIKELENKVENLGGQITAKDELISGLENKVSEKEAEISEIENKVSEKEAKIVELEAIVNESKIAAIKNVVDSAISSGKFVEENRDSLTKQATTLGVENFSEMIDMVKLPQANAVGQIQNNSNDTPKATKDEKLAAEYQELADKDPAKLAEIKNLEPARFELMFNAWNQ